jgi:hypothetical protein
MNKKKALLVGIADPIRIKSKRYVLEKLYQRAKKNPFVNTDSFEDYMEHVKVQIKTLEGKDVNGGVDEIYDTLKKIGWIKEISVWVFSLITTHNALA